jgi:hypothetical protein
MPYPTAADTHPARGQSRMNQSWPSCELIGNNERARVCVLEGRVTHPRDEIRERCDHRWAFRIRREV